MQVGFYAEQLGDVAVHTFTDSSEAAVDAWGAALARHIASIPADQPFRVLMDVSSHQVSFSRYARQKSQEMFSRYRARRGRFAFLFSSRTAPFYARIFFSTLGRLSFELGYFSDRARALEWLRE